MAVLVASRKFKGIGVKVERGGLKCIVAYHKI